MDSDIASFAFNLNTSARIVVERFTVFLQGAVHRRNLRNGSSETFLNRLQLFR